MPVRLHPFPEGGNGGGILKMDEVELKSEIPKSQNGLCAKLLVGPL
jgi:hypothetical protein